MVSEEARGKVQRAQYNIKLHYLRKWLEDLPKLDSHYRRQYSKKIYFEADFISYKEIYDLYLASCNENNENEIGSVSFPNFMKLFKISNYALFKPRNDQCDLCLSYKANNLSKQKKRGDPTVKIIRALAYEQTGTIYFKTNIDENYAQLPQRTGNKINIILPSKLHEQRLKVSKKKWQNLHDLNKLLPFEN
ncbi:hypothetical protein CVS40_11589 [Lucilia cuprina]|nr:hypothetical protein CVS40_11589 [Lucilia cuprina]